jgi:isoamylase
VQTPASKEFAHVSIDNGKLKLDVQPGSPAALGSVVSDEGVNFALFSGSAERVELCLFDSSGENEIERIELPEYTNEVWHCFIPGMKEGQLYGYRVHGQYAPEDGHRFNASKLLLDPYAYAYKGDLRWNDALYGYDINAVEDKDLIFSESDSAPFMPKCVVTSLLPERSGGTQPNIAWDRTLFYETHVRGATMLHPAIPDALRGTFDGLGHKAIVDYVKSLGITSIELLPVHAFVDDHHLVAAGRRNHWGYNTIGFFALKDRYLGRAGIASFRDMVRSFHDAGIEVILDVVYNHTAEGNELGSTLSFKGIDNASYYRLMPDNPRHYVNDTGTGNTVNTSHPRVLQMVMDSLRYFTRTMEVDGFRFDLGTILGREPHGFDQRSGFFDAMGQDPVLNRVKLIGEPWDIGPGGYQVGGFPPGWAEWNDKYRDTVRDYWKGSEGTTRDLAARVTGSGDVYDLRGRRPWSSVNFITAHDGFTLNDVVSYNEKHNDANGEDNKDGHGDNRSFNHGAEGKTDDAGIIDVRERQKRNLLATLLISHGTPMLLAGDEFGRTQDGNNNVYCQDNEIGWTRWADITPKDEALTDFTRRMIALRGENEIFRRISFRDSCDIRWLNPAGGDQTDEHWDDAGARTIGLRLSSQTAVGAKDVLVLFNSFDGDLPFACPEHPAGRPWQCVVDTASQEPSPATDMTSSIYQLTARSLVILM